LIVAQIFEKTYQHVLRDIAKITESKSGLSEEFNRLNFERISYKDTMNRKQTAYAMTRDGFVFLAMGYHGKRAAQGLKKEIPMLGVPFIFIFSLKK
jgi:Rha family phage regulatory protein